MTEGSAGCRGAPTAWCDTNRYRAHADREQRVDLEAVLGLRSRQGVGERCAAVTDRVLVTGRRPRGPGPAGGRSAGVPCDGSN